MSALEVPTARLRTYSSYELIGIAIENFPSRVVAARVHVEGIGVESRWELLDAVEHPLSEDLAGLLQRLCIEPISTAEMATLRTGVTSAAASISRKLLVEGTDNLALALGLSDPGCWQTTDSEIHGYSSLCDAAALAETVGVSVIDAFPARDIALGGRGGPLDSLPLWLLFHDSRRAQLVIDIQQETHLTYLPASCEANGASRVATFGLGPGQGLLTSLRDSDLGEPLSDQKVRSEKTERLSTWLISAWESVEHLWLPAGAVDTELADCFADYAKSQQATLAEAEQAVCVTLVHFIAENVANRVPRHPPLGQFIFAQENSLSQGIQPLLSDRFSDVLLASSEELNWPTAWLPAACSAALAMLHIEQIPSGGTLQTGASAARVLGRLTPGTPANWRRLLKHFSDNQPTTMSLRSAI